VSLRGDPRAAGPAAPAQPPRPIRHGTFVTVTGDLFITGDAGADELLNHSGLALMIGMLLDQQVPMEWAFAGPSTLRSRLGQLDAGSIAAMPVDDLVAVCCDKPAIHRFPAVMARRIHALSAALVADHGGRAESLWSDVDDGRELYRRLRALPGFGDEKAKIFVALLAKRFGVRPAGWDTVAAPFADDRPRTIADIHDAASLATVREWKRAQKVAGKDKQDRSLARDRA
jgi:uncharacterized HhH-GPD family protein